jgi:hypothetical protein
MEDQIPLSHVLAVCPREAGHGLEPAVLGSPGIDSEDIQTCQV